MTPTYSSATRFPRRSGLANVFARLWVPIAVCCSAVAVHAQTADLSATPVGEPLARSVYLQSGGARAGTDSATLGITLPWAWPRQAIGAPGVTAYVDVYASRWSIGDDRIGPSHYWLIGATPTLRYRFDAGRAPVFVDGGVGITVTNRRYQSVFEQFSTSYNFASHVAFGFNLGNAREHEISLRYQHLSNAGIKKPNPGENFAQVRYAYRF